MTLSEKINSKIPFYNEIDKIITKLHYTRDDKEIKQLLAEVDKINKKKNTCKYL